MRTYSPKGCAPDDLAWEHFDIECSEKQRDTELSYWTMPMGWNDEQTHANWNGRNVSKSA